MRRLLSAHVLALVLAVCSAASANVVTGGGRDYFVIGESGQPTYNVRLALVPPPQAQEVRSVGVLFGADEAGNGYAFRTDGGDWTLMSVSPAGLSTLARGSGIPLPTAGPLDLIVERRDLLLSVALNGRTLAEVADADHFEGLVAVDPTACGPGDEPIIQAIGRLHFEDGFMRPEDDLSLGQWEVKAGQWRLHSVQEDVEDVDLGRLPAERRPQSERSANPFSLSARAEDWGLLTTGYWFWDDYRAEVSLRDAGAAATGLAFNVGSAQDFFLLRWENGAEVLGPTCIQLLRVRGSERTELARAWVNGEQGQWYRLGVETCGRRMRALLDGAVIMDVRHDESVGGRIGLYVEGGDEHRQAFFDDVEVASAPGYSFDDELWLTQHVSSRTGRWGVRRVERPARPPNYAATLESADGRAVLGHGGWRPPLVSARVSPPAGGGRIGFELGLERDEPPLTVALEGGRGRPRLSVRCREAAGEVELATCDDFEVPADGPVELAADLTRPGELNVYVDGRLQLHVPRTAPAMGAVALFAVGMPGAEFRDVRVAFEREEDQEREPSRELFREDPFMLHWSSPKGAWWPAEGRRDAWWHVGDFFGRSEAVLPLRPGTVFVHSAEAVAPEGGYALVQEDVPADEGEPARRLRLRLLRKGAEVAAADVASGDADDRQLVLCKEGRYLWVRAAGEEALTFRDANPLPGTRAAVLGLSEADLARVKVRRCNVRDYLFDRAPADWHRVGNWRVTTRFSCDPRWSFMAALASQTAALFSKFRYEGDITLEAYMGARMPGGDWGGRYWRIGDFNLGLCEELLDLGGGYKFIVAGWDRFWSDRDTSLLKGAERVAGTYERLLPNVRRENTQARVIPVPWIQGGRDIHGAWYYIKARKQGGRLASYVENHQAYSYEDAEPLRRFSPVVWTYDSHIVVARVRVSYERMFVPGRLVEPPEPEPQPELPAVAAPLIVSESHPGFFDDFEGGLTGWQGFEDQQGAALGVTASTAASGRHSLRVLNPGPGGLMAAIAPVEDARIRIANARVLSFDYRVPPEVKLNLFVKVGRQYYYVHLNGPDEANAFYLRLGELSLWADDEWHHAEFPLAAAYRNAGGERNGVIGSIVFGNLHRGLLQAGIGGNPAHAAYYVDNFKIASAGPVEFRAQVRRPQDAAGVLAAVDDRPSTIPQAQQPLEADVPSGGEWFCHARVVTQDGAESGVAHLPFLVAAAPLEVTAADPAPGSPWGYGPIELQFAQKDAPLLNDASLRLSVNGQPVPRREGLFAMDWLANRLSIRLQESEPGISDGSPCRIELAYADQWGRNGAFQADYVASLAEDGTPPEPVKLAGYLPVQDFETGLGTWEATRDVALMRDDATAAAGRWSLKVQNLRWASAFMAFIMREGFSAGQYPIVELDYNTHEGVQFDLVANNTCGQATVGLSDQCRYGYYVGEVADFRSDGQWRHATINLLDGLSKMPYRRGMHQQRWLALGDFGYRANSVGAYYHVDNVRFVPLVSGLKELTLQWEARDAAGVEGYSYLWSSGPADAPDDQVDSARGEGKFGGLTAPDAYFHVKALDRAGNWGPVSHFRFLVDAAPPAIARVSPADGERSATSQIEVAVKDAGSAVDPETLTLTVDGRPYEPYSRGLSYDTESGRLVWDGANARPPEQRSIPDGAVVKLAAEAADFAGNAAAHYEWQWVMDHSLDKDPPTMPTLSSPSLAVRVLNGFENGTGSWRNARGNDWGAQIKPVWRDEEHGERCLELFAAQANAHFDAVAFEQDYDLEELPVISFDYAMPEDVRVNMQVRVNNAWFSVKMTAPGAAYQVLGEVPDMQPDGGWHHVTLDLLGLARQEMPQAGKYVVNAISFGDPARNRNRKNARWFVDNFMVSGYAARQLEAAWRSEDVTGVAGYSVLFNREMATVPPHEVNTEAESGRFEASEPGVYWLHVSAYDGNGNWSHPCHLAFPVAPPAEPAPPAGAAGG